MSLPNYLAKIKSSGIYRFVWDKSEITATDAETLRLVVGYSEKGPFNTPVYIDNTGDFITTFGGINKKLEKRGVFFHRMALQALAAGPILCLNLKKFTEEGEKAEKLTYATIEGVKGVDISPASKKTLVKNVYDTTRFWAIDPDKLNDLDNVSPTAGTSNNKQYITIATTDSISSSCSFFIRPCAVSGYDVTIKTWYATTGEEMPDYFIGHENMKVSDFFAEIYVFKGEFTPALAQSVELQKYFKIDEVTSEVSLQPYIVNAFGQKIDTLDALASNECSGFIQKYQGVVLPFFKNATGAYISLDLLFNGDYAQHKMLMKFNADLLDEGMNGTTEFTVDDVDTRGWDQITIEGVQSMVGGVGEYNGITVLGNEKVIPSLSVSIVGDDDVTTGVVIGTGDDAKLGSIDPSIDYELNSITIGSNVTTLGTSSLTTTAPISKTGIAVGDRFLMQIGSEAVATTLSEMTVTIGSDTTTSTTLKFTAENGKTGIQPIMIGTSAIGSIVDNYTLIRCNRTITTTGTMKPAYLEGYTPNPEMEKPADGTVEAKLAWQKKVLDTINTNSSIGYPGLVEALTNRVDIDYRYIVDTFESYVDNELKSSLALVAKQKDNCLLLTNFPSINTFVKSKNVSFTDSNNVFNMKYVKDGCNRTKPASLLFSLPSEENGASWCSFNTPLIFSDGTVKTTVPAAALVSNNFMEKYAGRQPYYIVAGPNYGRLNYSGMIGPDYNFSRADLDILEPLGVNATVYVPRRGTYINSNQTAKQNPVTALSKINVRELVIYLQDQIEDLLQKYQWEFNTSSLREVIKAKADTICENVRANGGIYNFLNVCDETNNTDDVINNEMIVLSTFIEPGMGAGKMVQELTIYKKGGMTAVIK